MKKNGFTTLLKATAVLASIGGLAYVYRDKILGCPVVSSLKEKISGSEEDIFDEEDYFEESTNTSTEDVASREYVSLDIESTKKAAEELEETMTLQEMEDAIEEEIQLENELEDAACEATIEEEVVPEEEAAVEEEITQEEAADDITDAPDEK